MEVTEEVKQKILASAFFKGKVVTGSMVPVINIGDTILVKIKDRELKRFDIIVFVQDGKLICHYLWNMNKFIQPLLMQTRSMKGKKDFPIREEDYIGKVVSHRISWWRLVKIILLG